MMSLSEAYGRLKVLVIEDEAVTRQSIRRILERIGFTEVVEAADGAAGFAAVRAERPDIVLCDIHMQPVDGQAFLALLRAAEEDWIRALPVLVLTGDNQVDTVRVATHRDIEGFVVKPASHDGLKKHIDVVVMRLLARGPD